VLNPPTLVFGKNGSNRSHDAPDSEMKSARWISVYVAHPIG
jgi:hypothetical protein